MMPGLGLLLTGLGGGFRRTLSLRAARGVVPAPLTFTRTGGAAFWNAAGTLVQVGADVPRFGADGLLNEGTRGTLFTDSQIAAGAGWVNSGVATTPTDGPDGGGTSAIRLDDGTSSVQHRSEVPSFEAVNGTTYTSNWIVRAGTCTSCQILGLAAAFGGSQGWANFDLTGNGAVGSAGSNTTGRIRRRGAWFEISATMPAIGTNVGRNFMLFMADSPTMPRAANYLGSNRTLDVFHAWAEAAPIPSSPIINSGGVATRFGDIATAPWASVAPRGECTVLFAGTLPSAELGGNRILFGGDDGSGNNRWHFRTNGAGSLQIATSIAATPASSSAIIAAAGDVLVRGGVTYKSGALVGFAAGGTLRSLPGVPPCTTFRIGTRNGNLDPGFIRGLLVCDVIDRAVPDAVLQQLVNALPTA